MYDLPQQNIGEIPLALRIGMAAPDFTARTTQGQISLSDYRGQWVMLFSHPADFTPVCTSEFISIARAADKFKELGCVPLALSVDSLFSHLAWIRTIRDATDVTIDFPIIEDPTLQIASAYGMVDEGARDAATVRASFFIDPEGFVRALNYYPATVGRSVEELLRMIAALQRSDASQCLTPEGWQPGDDLLRPPAQQVSEVLKADGAADWFFHTTKDEEN